MEFRKFSKEHYMSKEYYKKRLIDLRSQMAKEREAKKKDNANYAARIKTASPSSKPMYRKQKVDRAASHDRKIESLKKEIERIRDALKRAK